MGIGERLKEVKEALDLTQRGIARKLRISPGTWQVYEHGSSIPGGKVLRGLAQLGVNINWVLTGEGRMMADGQGEESELPPGFTTTYHARLLCAEWTGSGYNLTFAFPSKDIKAGVPIGSLCMMSFQAYGEEGQ